MSKTYEIVRFYQNKEPRVIKKGLSLEDAQRHCNNPETSSKGTSKRVREITRRHGPWFDGYRAEKK